MAPFLTPGRIFEKDETDSTQSDARRLIEGGGARHGDICTALFQREGRGRIAGRTWEGERESALMMSLLLEKGRTPLLPPLSLILGLGAALTLERHYAIRPHIKWPNDVYLNGKKCGGILCETQGPWWICGMGINLNQKSFPPGLEEKAVSVRQIGGEVLDREEFMARLREEILLLLPLPSGDILNALEERLLWKGMRKTLLLGDPRNRETLTGIIRGIHEDGALLLETEGGTRPVYSAEFPL